MGISGSAMQRGRAFLLMLFSGRSLIIASLSLMRRQGMLGEEKRIPAVQRKLEERVLAWEPDESFSWDAVERQS